MKGWDSLRSKRLIALAFSTSVIVTASAFYVTEFASDGSHHNKTDASEEAQSLYPVNKAGETYGKPVDPLHPPDLLLAQGTDGTIGYVRSSELIGEDPATPEEAVKRQLTLNPDGRAISLYEHDGKTVIGEFKVTGP